MKRLGTYSKGTERQSGAQDMPGTGCVAGELAMCGWDVWVEWIAPLSHPYKKLLLSLKLVKSEYNSEKSNHFPCDLGSLSLCLVL